ncbi:hypothetical protein KsCSTR_37240 [Candidatus Kuenenia stuttgartiensis]|uniref:Uncharacterized protein n=1 Tax=Kuenenia stuttgartiensis TaxID=174633 RepID=Q1Q6A2_KUEST|nr:hypothetical protein KsCSTR_37240 [Candidatus Kuenenia stuttgartiensis]CAJ73096.1 unknown protein [Candidatus Kuenenia stuttgartiensis]
MLNFMSKWQEAFSRGRHLSGNIALHNTAPNITWLPAGQGYILTRYYAGEYL